MNYKNMYELYRHILENNITVKSSKKYEPMELVERIFYYTITGDIRYVPRPIRNVIKKTYEHDTLTLKEWIDSRIQKREGYHNNYFFQPIDREIPDEGYKIHISVPETKTKEFAEFISAVLESHGIPFKVVRSDERYRELNNGPQRGKFVTIYPIKHPNNVFFIKKIAEYFTNLFSNLKIESPDVMTDLKYKGAEGNIVYYRYYKDDDPNDRDPKNKLKGHPHLEEYNEINNIPSIIKKGMKKT